MPDPNNYVPIDEVEEWKATIPALQDGWPPNGGPVDPVNNGGLLNWPLLHLASRTLWLKAHAEQLATDLANIDVSAQINAAIDALVNGAPAALDTLSELATALQGNDDEIAALVGSIATKLSKDQNLSDLTDVAAARLALQIKSAALRDITDGDDLSIDGENVALRKNVLAAIAAAISAAPKPIKAWVTFNGTGTVAINAAMNVSSITDNGTGTYTLNFASDLDDANYAVSGSATGSAIRIVQVDGSASDGSATLKTTSAVKINVRDGNGTLRDNDNVSVIIAR